MSDFFHFPTVDAAPIVIDPKLKRAQSLVGSSSDGIRASNDWYPTPPEATEALLRVETFDGDILEPACGDGSMSRVLEAHGYVVHSYDLIYRNFGEGGHDFLASAHRAANVVTNPPFTLAEEFVKHALDVTTGKVAILAKLAFLEGAKRRVMFESTPLKSVYVFSKRVSFYANGEKGDRGNSMIAFCWLVWQHGYGGKPELGWI